MSDQIAILLPVDPQSQGWQARTGTMGYSFVTQKLYIKIGGDPTDWTQVSTSQSEIGVETVTGDNVDNTDPKNPIVGSGLSTVHTSSPVSGDGSADLPVTIADAAIANAKLANMLAHTAKVRKTNSTGAPEDTTMTELTALLDAATVSLQGLLTAVDKTKLNALPGTWTTVSIPSDTTDVILSASLNGDTDGGYEIDYVSAPTSDTSTQLSLNVGVDGGAASATGCTTVTTFGNGSVTGSSAQTRLDILTASSVGTSQTQNARIMLEGVRTGLPRTFLALGVRLTLGGTTNIANWWTSGTYQATGNITTLTLHASTSNGIKAGGLLRYRKLNS